MSDKSLDKQTTKLYEVRCAKCDRLLMKTSANGDIEIKCPKCGFINRTKLQHGKGYVLEKKENKDVILSLN